MVDLLAYFWQCLHYHNIYTWWQVRQGQILQYRCYYALVSDRRMSEMIGIWYQQIFTSDQFSLPARFILQPTQCHGGYLKRRRAFPLSLETVTNSLADAMFQALKEMERPKPPLTRAPMPQWMSYKSLSMIDARSDHHRQPDYNHNVAWTLTKEVRNSFAVDTWLMAEVVAAEIGACLETPQGIPSDIQGAYSILNWWYWHASGRQPHPTCTYLEKISEYYAAM